MVNTFFKNHQQMLYSYSIVLRMGLIVVIIGYNLYTFLPDILLRRGYHYQSAALVIYLSRIFGLLLAGYLGDSQGRKWTLLVANASLIPTTLLLSLATSWPLQVISLLVFNVGMGMLMVVIPCYLIEVAPPRCRGQQFILFWFFLMVGVFFRQYLQLVFPILSSHSIRLQFRCEALAAVLSWLLFLFLPKSPRWLVVRSQPEQAFTILEKTRIKDHLFYEEKQLLYLQSCRKQTSWRRLFNLRNRNLLILIVVMSILIQTRGVHVAFRILSYLSYSVNSHFHGHMMVLLISITAVYMAGLLLSGLLIDRLGPRKLIVTGLAGMVLSYAFFTIINLSLEGHINTTINLLRSLVVKFFYGVGPSGAIWLVFFTWFATPIRAKGIAFISTLHFTSLYLEALLFSSLENTFGLNILYWSGTLTTLIALVLCIEHLPKAKQTILEAITLPLSTHSKRLS